MPGCVCVSVSAVLCGYGVLTVPIAGLIHAYTVGRVSRAAVRDSTLRPVFYAVMCCAVTPMPYYCLPLQLPPPPSAGHRTDRIYPIIAPPMCVSLYVTMCVAHPMETQSEGNFHHQSQDSPDGWWQVY